MRGPAVRVEAPGRAPHRGLPSLQLMQAVLEDGLRTLIRTAGATRGRAVRRWREEFTWLVSRDRTHPFAFENVCEALDIDAGRLRGITLRETLAHRAGRGRYSVTLPRGAIP